MDPGSNIPENTHHGFRFRLASYARSLLPAERLSTGFWIFFTAAFFFDFSLGLYFFLFNLFLANLHFNEKIIGLITGALTLGNVAGTIPVSMLVKRFGLQKVLLLCFSVAPPIFALRNLYPLYASPVGLGLSCRRSPLLLASLLLSCSCKADNREQPRFSIQHSIRHWNRNRNTRWARRRLSSSAHKNDRRRKPSCG